VPSHFNQDDIVVTVSLAAIAIAIAGTPLSGLLLLASVLALASAGLAALSRLSVRSTA